MTESTIADVAKHHGLLPGQVGAVLEELGVQHDQHAFEADPDALELIAVSLGEWKGSKKLPLPPNRTVRDLAWALGVPVPEIQKKFMTKKVMATLTTSLKPDAVEQLVAEYGYDVVWSEPSATKPKAAMTAPAAKPAGAQPRPPVVTILGHVDHGKTSLLDSIRKANVAAKEHGGITQHIGAYQVQLPEGVITFLDTPGHAAFTAMRARGAQVTDIAVLVVAADDGIMPQTIEAISHAKNAGVPVIVAVNKIDRPDANPDRVIAQLTEHDLVPEAFGGQTIVCPVSAVTAEGIPHLLEMILLQAGILHLEADPKGTFKGVVIEAKLDKGRGPVATVLVQNGTLRVGDALVVGSAYGRVRSMTDYLGERLTEASPALPVEVLGLSDVPNAGETVEVATDDREARTVAEARGEKERVASLASPSRKVTLSDLRRQLESGESKDLNLIVKADVQGSVEAVRGLIEKIENPEIEVRVIHAGVGSITESDILLASASGAIVVGFNVKPEGQAKASAERAKVEIRTYTVIYELIEDIEAAVKGMLAPKFEEQYLGTVEIRRVFDLSRHGKVAGSYVTDGKVTRNAKVRIRRGTEIAWEGEVASLKHLKSDVREMAQGQECGLQFEGWEAFKEGDVVEAYEVVQVND